MDTSLVPFSLDPLSDYSPTEPNMYLDLTLAPRLRYVSSGSSELLLLPPPSASNIPKLPPRLRLRQL